MLINSYLYKNNVAFIIYENRQLDYFLSTFKLLVGQNIIFSIIINDLKNYTIDKSYLSNFLTSKVEIINLTEVLSKKIKYKMVISVNTYDISIKTV